MSPPEAVIFDLDGTLVDSAPDIGRALNGLLVEQGLEAATLAEVRSWVGEGAGILLRRAWRARGVEREPVLAPWLERFLDLYAAGAAVDSALYPGTLVMLDGLRSMGCRRGLCTNKPALHTGLVIDALGLRGALEAVIAGDTLPVRKPDPAPLRLAIHGCGLRRGILIGDGPADAGAARAAGVPFWYAGWGYGDAAVAAQAERTLDAPRDVLPALRERWGLAGLIPGERASGGR